MPIRRTCSFCGNEIEPGTGKMFIKKDGTVYVFCSSKCQNNQIKLRRVPRWTPWTQAFRRTGATVAEAGAEALVVEEAPAAKTAAVEVVIETPKGRDIPADLVDLINKKLGPDLPRGEIERHYHEFVEDSTFRAAILSWAKKSHPGKTITHIEKDEFLAFKDAPDGRRVFKSWLDGAWQKVKGRRTEPEKEAAPAPTAKKAKKGA